MIKSNVIKLTNTKQICTEKKLHQNVFLIWAQETNLQYSLSMLQWLQHIFKLFLPFKKNFILKW